MMRILGCLLVALAIGVAGAMPVEAQIADAVLLDGKVVTQAAAGNSQALAIHDGKVLAVGPTDAIRKHVGPGTKVIDLGGRTVIPGLIDSHIHAIRAALFYATEVNWIDTRSIPEAMERMSAAARKARPGQWLIVAGGWTEQQFKERRRPTQAEVMAAAPDNPVYVQLFYSNVLLTPAGFKALGINGEADLPTGNKFDLDAAGKPTGWINGAGLQAIAAFFSKLPLPTFEQKVEGTRQFFREMNRLGVTGVVDPGGFNMAPADYQPLFKVWRDGELSVRVVFSLFAQRPNKELEDFQALTQMLPQGMGGDMLRFNGIGELVTYGMYNNDSPTDDQKQQLYEAARWAAGRGLTLTHHWQNGRTVQHLLDVFERVDKETPIAPLRWSIAHLNLCPPAAFERMRALGVGWTMQNAMYFDSVAFMKRHGAEAIRLAPPIKTAMRLGIHVGAGTDAHRVMSYNPMVALQWMVDGRTVGGEATRVAEEMPTREEALRLYTVGSAWFAHDEGRRGTLEPGRLADLAVLSQDYLTIPADEIGRTQSLLTMVGGRIVYAATPYAEFLDTRAAK